MQNHGTLRAERSLFQRIEGAEIAASLPHLPLKIQDTGFLCAEKQSYLKPASRMHQHLGTTWDRGWGGEACREISRWTVRQFIDIYITRINVFPKIAFPFSALKTTSKRGRYRNSIALIVFVFYGFGIY